MYGATNPAFIPDNSPPDQQQPLVSTASHKISIDGENTAAAAAATTIRQQLPLSEADDIPERQEDERESWDSKVTFLLATIG